MLASQARLSPVTVHLEISEHACLRWLERRHGLDLDKIRSEIHAAALPAASLGATRVSVHGVTIVITDTVRGKIVATILPMGGREGEAIANGYQKGKTNITRRELGKIKRRDRQRNNRTPAGG